MSLIEQAARRLEELRRAGADLPEAREAAPKPTPTDSPIPEAIIKALEERPTDLPMPFKASIRTDARGRARESPTPPIRPSGREVNVNLARLKTLGFVTPDAPTSRIADEFRVVKRPIIRNALGQSGAKVKNGNLVMVTSAVPGEGKTFTSINLAMSMAMEFDSRVLLVDGDVAHPSLPLMLGTPHAPGLLDLLTRDDIDVTDALVKTNVERLTLLPAGSRQRRSTELLASEQMASLLRELASRYPDRLIIFDSPPLLATTEARVLATHMGQIVMVVAADATSHHALQQALATIESCDIVLMLLNKASRTEVGTYYGYYGDEAAQ
jgi:receptor protein-tyrosine kinase